MPSSSKDPIEQNAETVLQDRAAQIQGERRGRPSLFVCPECGGTLWQVDEPELVQFRCHVGHVLSGGLLLQEQARMAENGLWYTIRTLTDTMVLARELAEYARRRGEEESAAEFEAQARRAEQQVQALRHMAASYPSGNEGETP